MSRPLKTVFLLEDLCFGGTQKQNLALACRLNRGIFEPVIVTLTGPADLDAFARNANVQLINMGATRRPAPFFFGRLPKILASLAPDILVPCTALPNIWGRIWGRLLSIPVIVGTVRGGGAPVRQHEWLLARLCHGIVCNSRQLAMIMSDIAGNSVPIHYIANGVDSDHFVPPARKPQGQTIICVARIAKDKDHLTLVRAFALLAPDFPAARLCIVGEGPEERNLKNFVATQLNPAVAGRIKFAGASADPLPYLQAADIFVLSSIREGQPNVILEAMACGLPVCASNVGGIPDLVTDNGLLFPVGDVKALASNLRELLENPQKAKEMGQNGRNRVTSDFSFASMVERHQNFFLELWEKQQLSSHNPLRDNKS